MIIKITQRDHDDDEMMPIKGFQALLEISPLSSVYCRRGEPSHLWPFYHREDLEDASDADDIDAKDESPSAMSDPANDSLEPRTMPKEAIIKPDALLCLGVPSISLNCSSTCRSRIISKI